MRRTALITAILLALPLALPAGCGEQAPPDYRGEPLMTVHGVLVSELAQPLPETDIVIGWPDWSKGDGTSAPFASFARLPLATTLPARFSATISDPPPETAYAPAQTRATGPRFTSAVILLARHGKEVSSTEHLSLDLALRDPNQAVLASFDSYLLTYFDSDGTIAEGPRVTKGFHLMRQDRVVCALSYDEACIADNIAVGFPADIAWQGCVSTSETVNAVDLPVDTEITLTLEDPTAPPKRPPLCKKPPGA